MNNRKLPVGIQDFGKIRREGYFYVDKTQYIGKLLDLGQTFFLSRPRRFGKSLFVSTLEHYFRGDKELFKGLWIEQEENKKGADAWTEYPVITFYLSGGEYNDNDGLSDRLDRTIKKYTRVYGLTGDFAPSGETLAVRFMTLIEGLYNKTGHGVVVLVDEYDKPLLATMITNEEQEERNRELYKGFFSVLKDMDEYLKFVFFTGVTKFTKVSIFSDLNQLNDISLDNDYSGICGITQDELLDYFDTEISALADEQNISHNECIEQLKKMYDGYHFANKGVGVYNPFSLLNALSKRRFGRYWFGTGTPDILLKKLKNSNISLADITDGVQATEDTLQDYRVDDDDPVPLFYQTGYLTIRDYDRRFSLYTLGFPNDEVKYGFLNSLKSSVLGYKNSENPVALEKMIMDIEKGDIDSFMNRLTSLFAAIPYPEGKAPAYEGEWSRQLFLILELMGAYTQCEVHMATGRADCVVQTSDYIYVFEFKLDKPVEEALAQIDDRGYMIPYQVDTRRLYKIGVSFSSEKRNVDEWKVIEVDDE